MIQNTKERQFLAQEVGSIRSGMLLIARTIEAINEGDYPDNTRRFEIFEGMIFLMDLLAEKLKDVYQMLIGMK
ncbi:MAG: hypothetical protein MI892_15200 [Desulfobacterales bacterium]|nr:hypothetical protein [Desulfobacterales bacterium]